MSAANYSDLLSRPAAVDAWAGDLAHDLRQPLGNIQSAVCYLKLILHGQDRALAHLDLIEQQVFESEAILTAAVASARSAFVQPAGTAGGGNFALTNAESAGVT